MATNERTPMHPEGDEVSETDEARLRRCEERLAPVPSIHIDRQANAPTTCKIWRSGVLVFDGIDRTVLAVGAHD